jgi:plastocyanin domain-containing protein
MSTQNVREIEIVVERGYHPGRVTVAEGEAVRLKFLRREAGGCSRELVIPALGLRRELPQGQEVAIDLPAMAAGEYAFTCGMNMLRGSVVVEAA